MNEFTGWNGESRSKLVDTSRESDLLQEIDSNYDGPQRHGLNSYESPNENWFLQTSDEGEKALARSHFVKTEIPFPTREKDPETLLAEKMDKEFKEKEAERERK